MIQLSDACRNTFSTYHTCVQPKRVGATLFDERLSAANMHNFTNRGHQRASIEIVQGETP
jgi:hypothetical protein